MRIRLTDKELEDLKYCTDKGAKNYLKVIMSNGDFKRLASYKFCGILSTSISDIKKNGRIKNEPGDEKILKALFF